MGVQVVGSGRGEGSKPKTKLGAAAGGFGGIGKREDFSLAGWAKGGRESTKYLAEHDPEHCAFVPKGGHHCQQQSQQPLGTALQR